MSATGTPATDLLRRSGVPHVLHAYETGTDRGDRRGRKVDQRPSYGRDAAAALGVDEAQVFKTLVAELDGRLVAAVVPVACDLDLKRLAAALGGRRAAMADPAAAERATGYVVGGISPLGGRRALATVVDESALARPTIYVSAGRRGLQVELAGSDLVRLTGARVAAIARPG
ncbi:MAG TPA: Cys-tRNA(Pro) deacylase [Candidatus Limnocylindrales bacterium]|nr:Cys-tRNA(Pro) deacylase [Candidatus Limnocylindrales bacterium]